MTQPRMDISIVIPLCDRRTAGWNALRSAIGQAYPRDRYEVIAVRGRGIDTGKGGEDVAALLGRCDAVVNVDVDAENVTNEARLYYAGCERARGELLFFIEGHTVLVPEACSIIAEYFREHPQSLLACAPRRNHGESPLGALVSAHNLEHERRAAGRGTFSYGANSVIRRGLFERLGGLDARWLRQSETAVFDRVVREKIGIGSIDAPLATHYNDMPVRHCHRIVMSAGAGKWHYYNGRVARGEDLRAVVRHRVYVQANRAWAARLLYPVFRVAGTTFLLLALGTWRVGRTLAYRLYVVGLGCTDLSGFCRARIEAGRSGQAD